MQFKEEETALLKTWAIKKLEDISDADADVLADYAIALVSTEDAEEVAKANCVESLIDFLPNKAEHFVDELFAAIANKSYDPSQHQPKPATEASRLPPGPKSDGLGPMNKSRKRSFQWDTNETSEQHGHFHGGGRPIKQMRRGGRGGLERGGRHQQGGNSTFAPQQLSQQPQMPNLPPNIPPFDPNDPVQMMALQQFMNGMPGFSGAASPQNGVPFRLPRSTQRCRDYDTKGFCATGASCPYDHGNDRFVIPPQSQEYDPANAMLNLPPTRTGGFNGFSERGRGGMRGRGRGNTNFRGGGKRSDFSQLGPNRDSNNTSVVVEQIPDDKLDETSIRNFFSEFGDIEEVVLHPDRKLAVLKFVSKSSAKAAYDSPKVIFDNRFVKVYWYNPEKFEQENGSGTPAARPVKIDVDMQDEEQIDPVELAKRQDEAQRKHEEAQQQREDTAKQKADLDQKLREMEAERKKVADRLAKKTGRAPSPTAGSPNQNGHGEESEKTKGLRAQLATLEAEAKELGIDPDAAMSNGNGYDGYGHQPYRGGGGFRGRARGRSYYQPYRGGWGGGPARGGAVRRLDNRPKTIAVTFVNDKSYDTNDEALRQYLLFNSMETSSITKHADKENTALVTFNQRYEGENFMRAAAAGIPHAGKVEAFWHSGPAVVKTGPAANGDQSEHWNGKFEVGSDAGDREMYDNEEREEQDLDRYA